MTGNIVEIVCASGHRDSICSSAEQQNAELLSESLHTDEPVQISLRFLVPAENVQRFLDRLQSQLPQEASPLILVQPVQAILRSPDSDEKTEQVSRGSKTTREELYAEIRKGTRCDWNFAVLAILATLVAAIGLAEDNIAVIIAAMVIAPLLGPNLGLALGAALGDRDLIKDAVVTNFVGVSLTIGLSILMVQVWPLNLESTEIVSRTEVRASSIVVALAAGIAAAQSLTTRLSGVLVGVMVAVALVPPATVLGMMIGTGDYSAARGAALLLAVNIVSVNLSAQLVFIVHRIRPRSWFEQKEATQSRWINFGVWAVLLLMAIILVWSWSR